MKLRTTVVALLLLSLLTTACSSSQILSSLQNVIAAVEVGIPLLGGTVGITPATSALVNAYLQAASSCANEAASILSSADTDGSKAVQIVAACSASSIAPVLPDGTPKLIISLVSQVAKALTDFLAHFPKKMSVNHSTHMTVLSDKDKTKLAELQHRAIIVKTKLQVLKK